MNTTTPTVPTSTELQELLEAFDTAWTHASGASAARDRSNAVLDPIKHDLLHQVAGDAHYAVGVAKERLAQAHRRAGTALDHVHGCEKPTPAGLVREAVRLRDEVTRLRGQIETLGGNAAVAEAV